MFQPAVLTVQTAFQESLLLDSVIDQLVKQKTLILLAIVWLEDTPLLWHIVFDYIIFPRSGCFQNMDTHFRTH